MLYRLSKVALLLGVTLVALVGYTQMQQRARVYNPATEVTVSGKVDDVVQTQGKRGGTGTHIMLKSGSDLVTVHLGPSAFLAKNNFAVAKGDQVEVTGSKVQLGGKDVIIAREVKKGGSVVTLRDSAGIPKWRGSQTNSRLKRGGRATRPSSPFTVDAGVPSITKSLRDKLDLK